jgi:hypothetical protein
MGEYMIRVYSVIGTENMCIDLHGGAIFEYIWARSF